LLGFVIFLIMPDAPGAPHQNYRWLGRMGFYEKREGFRE